jgi:pimeloyl-ACP methyl ester carboxylesterase
MTKDVVSDLRRWATDPLTRPTLYVMGGHDYIFLELARRVAARDPLAELKVVAESGHVCNVERPGEFNRLSLAFIRRA